MSAIAKGAGEAPGPVIAGFRVGGLGYAATFGVLAGMTVLVAFVRDPKTPAAYRS